MPSKALPSGSVVPPLTPRLPDEPSSETVASSGFRDVSIVEGEEGVSSLEDEVWHTPPQSLESRNPQVVGVQPLIQIEDIPAPVEAAPAASAIALPARPQINSSLFERLLASVIIWVMDFKQVRAKVSFRKAAVVRQLNKRLKWVRKAIRNKPRKKTLEERRVLKRQLMRLHKEKKQARAARDYEIRSYLQLLRSLKALHKGTIPDHTVHLDGLVLQGGKATLRNVELRVRKVELVNSQTGEAYPKITVDIKGSVDVNAPGQPPLKLDIEVKDMEASIQGRMVPGINAYIRGKGMTGLIKAFHRIRKQKGKFFQLSRAGVAVGKVKASLDELDPRTLIAIKGSSRTTVKEDISRMFSVLGHPFDLTVHELEVARKGVAAPLARMEGLKVAYELKPVEQREGETERTLTVKSDTVELDTGGVSEALYGIAREKKLKPMGLLPSNREESYDWITELEKQSTGVKAQVWDLQMKMHVSKDDEGRMVAGNSDLELSAEHLELRNSGSADVRVGLDGAHLKGKLTGDKTEFNAHAKTVSARLGLKQKLGAASSNSIDCHSDFAGQVVKVSGTLHEGQVQTNIETSQLAVDTHGHPSSIHLGDTRIELPGDLGGQVQALSAHLKADNKGDSELKARVGKTHFSGEGQVVINTRDSKLSVPVRGNVTVDQCEMSSAKKKEGDLRQSVTVTEVSPGNISIDGVKASSVKVGNLTTELDEQRSGYVYLNDVFVNGDDVIKDLELLPEATRQKIPTGFLKGRKLKASVKVKVEKGLIDPKAAEFVSYDLDEKAVDTSAWTQWSSWDQWFRSGLMSAAKWASVKGMNVVNGQLFISVGMGPFSYPISVMKVPQEAVRGEKLSLPVLLHNYTGVCWGETPKDDREIVDKINAGDLQALSSLAAYCRGAGPDRAERLLKMLQFDPWVERSKQGDQLSGSYLKTLTGLLFEYPGTAGRGLMLFRSLQWPVTRPLAEALLKPPYRSEIDPVTLALSVSEAGLLREASEVMEEALKKKPEDPRLNYHACVVLRKWVKSIRPDDMREDDKEYLIIESARRLSAATRKNYPAAQELQKQLCEEQEPYALLAEAGSLLTHVHKPSAFYKALNRLEQMATLGEGVKARAAKIILANRIENSRKIFIHPTDKVEKSIHALEKRIKHKGMHGTKPDELYRLGIRYLYGVECKVSNPARAIQLLKQASDRGEHRAQLHLELAESTMAAD